MTLSISRRQARLVQDVGKQDGRERHLLGRLEHHAVVGGNAGHHLVRHLVHRVVERRDGGDHAQQRRALRVHAALLAMVRQVAAEDLAVVLEHLVGAEQQHVAHAAGFVQRVLLAQAGLGGDEVGHLLHARRDDGRGLVEDGRALKACEPGLVGMRRGIGLAHLFQRGLGHAADLLAGVGVVHGDGALATGADLLAGDAHGVQRVVADVAVDVTHGGHPGLDPGSMSRRA
jgi:hypothetical protein